jgi:Outer membrane protein beta-barrel domain
MPASSVLVLCLVLGSATAASAQGVVVGIKGGVNFASIQFNEEGENVNFDRRTGFVGGVFVVWPASERFGLQLEALYSQKGARIAGSDVEAELRLDYVDVPVLLRVSTARDRSGAAFHVFGGPSVGIRARAKATAALEGESGSGDISEDVERLDLGLVAGAGVEIGRFVIDVRHTWGLSNINKNPSEDDTTIKNRVFAAMVGLRF